jgi:Tfp pilus assembly protein PilE
MGQQQLLLIVLGIIIVGIAIAVGVNMFQQSAVDANRQNVISDLTNLAAKAQRYYRTPTELGGGAQDFQNFSLGRLDTTNANGSYRCYTAAPTAVDNPPAPAAANTRINTSVTDTMYLGGWGKEDGDVATAKVKAYVAISPSSIQTTIVN